MPDLIGHGRPGRDDGRVSLWARSPAGHADPDRRKRIDDARPRPRGLLGGAKGKRRGLPDDAGLSPLSPLSTGGFPQAVDGSPPGTAPEEALSQAAALRNAASSWSRL